MSGSDRWRRSRRTRPGLNWILSCLTVLCGQDYIKKIKIKKALWSDQVPCKLHLTLVRCNTELLTQIRGEGSSGVMFEKCMYLAPALCSFIGPET